MRVWLHRELMSTIRQWERPKFEGHTWFVCNTSMPINGRPFSGLGDDYAFLIQ